MSAIKMLSITDDPNDRAGLMENILYIANNGADINAQDKNLDSVWHYVCQTSSQTLLEFMIDKGINIMLKNAKGQIGSQLLKTDVMRELYKECVCKF